MLSQKNKNLKFAIVAVRIVYPYESFLNGSLSFVKGRAMKTLPVKSSLTVAEIKVLVLFSSSLVKKSKQDSNEKTHLVIRQTY